MPYLIPRTTRGECDFEALFGPDSGLGPDSGHLRGEEPGYFLAPGSTYSSNFHQSVFTMAQIVVRVAGIWRVVDTSSVQRSHGKVDATCQSRRMYASEWAFPFAPGVTAKDVDGAPELRPNADGTAWVPHWTAAGSHRDHELLLVGIIGGHFQPLFRQYQVDRIKASTAEARTRADGLFVLTAEFYGEVLAAARTESRSKALGARHQDPHPETGHLQADFAAAVEVVAKEWGEARPEDLVKWQPGLAYIRTVLQIPSPETPWDRALREAAEAKAAEAASQE